MKENTPGNPMVGVRVTPDLRDWLIEEARRRDISVAELHRSILAEARARYANA